MQKAGLAIPAIYTDMVHERARQHFSARCPARLFIFVLLLLLYKFSFVFMLCAFPDIIHVDYEVTDL